MSARYANASEEALHESAIEALASEMHRPIAEIKQCYEHEFTILEDGARLRDFLSLCATRRTRELLRHSHGQHAGTSPTHMPSSSPSAHEH
jgi:predicted dienelactone hydrolase